VFPRRYLNHESGKIPRGRANRKQRRRSFGPVYEAAEIDSLFRERFSRSVVCVEGAPQAVHQHDEFGGGLAAQKLANPSLSPFDHFVRRT
jgi:hypothetical protein